MKTSILLATLLAALFLTACGEKAAEKPAIETAPAEVVPAEAAATPATAPTAEKAPEAAAGGYTPSAEELVPGITRTKEEQDKMNAEAMAGTPMPVIPGEAPAVAPAETTPAEAAPVEAAPVEATPAN
jgi:hypothetical protein